MLDLFPAGAGWVRACAVLAVVLALTVMLRDPGRRAAVRQFMQGGRAATEGDSSASPPAAERPEEVDRLWDRVEQARAARHLDSFQAIEYAAANLNLKPPLPDSTVEGWFGNRTVPVWERFRVLLRVLEPDLFRQVDGQQRNPFAVKPERRQEWKAWEAVHGAALAADRRFKKQQRARKKNLRKGARQASPSSKAVSWVWWAAIVLAAASPSSTVAPPQPVPSPSPGGRLCAYVTQEPAAVYPGHDRRASPLKYKYINDRIVVANRPHPKGWVAVITPRDDPGYNWMLAPVLTTPKPCTAPPPDTVQ